MLLDFGIGKETQQVEVRDDLVLDVLTASEYEAKDPVKCWKVYI